MEQLNRIDTAGEGISKQEDRFEKLYIQKLYIQKEKWNYEEEVKRHGEWNEKF